MTAEPRGVAEGSWSSDEVWMKHLEFIQGVITRMAGNSFLLKGWALTVSGALFGFSASHASWPIAVVGLLPIVAFWFLDGYFLMQERLYRSLYNAVARRDSTVPVFSLNATGYRKKNAMLDSIKSATLMLFYGGLLMAGLLLIFTSLLHLDYF